MFNVQLQALTDDFTGIYRRLVYNQCYFVASDEDIGPVFTLSQALERLHPTPRLRDKIYITALCLGHILWSLSMTLNIYETLDSPLANTVAVLGTGLSTSLSIYVLQQTVSYAAKRIEVEWILRQGIDKLWKTAEARIITLQQEINTGEVRCLKDREQYITHIQSHLDALYTGLTNCGARLNQSIYAISSARRHPFSTLKSAVDYLKPNRINKIVVSLLCLHTALQILSYGLRQYATLHPIILLGGAYAFYTMLSWYKEAYWRLYPSLLRQPLDEVIIAALTQQEKYALVFITRLKEKVEQLRLSKASAECDTPALL
jgi:hypothetical protein